MNECNDLIERCKEICAWQDTGLLKGDALRNFAASRPYAQQHNSFSIAQAETLREVADAFIASVDRIAELESRLEISPLHNVDGIMARDATIKLQDERIAELEAERAERERQEPIATVGWDRNFMGVVWHGKDMPEKGVETLLYAAPPVTEQGCVTVTTDESGRAVAVTRQDDDHRILSVIWEAPVAAPVRLMDEGIANIVWAGLANAHTFARAIETASLRANGFKVKE